MPRKDLQIRNRTRTLLTVGCIVTFLLFVLGFTRSNDLVGGPSENRVTMDEDLSEGWTTSDGHLVRLGHLSNIAGIYENGITIGRQLPANIEPGAEFNFLSKNCTLEVFYAGLLVYTFMPDPNVYGKPYEEYFNYVPLDPEDAGKEVTIHLMPAYSDVAVRITDVRVSGTATYIHHYLHDHGAAFLISLIIFFIGITVGVLDISMKSLTKDETDLRSLAAVATLLGIWAATETLVPQLITSSRSFWQALDSASLLFAPYPMFCFACSLVRFKKRNVFKAVSFGIAFVSYALVIIGAFVFGKDLHQLLVITHTHLVLQCLLFALAAVVTFIDPQYGTKVFAVKVNKYILVSFFVLLAFAMADFIVYVATQGDNEDPARFTRIGLFVFTIVISIEAFKTSIDLIRRADRIEEIEAIAYTDALTGIANRTAWQIMAQKIDKTLKEGLIQDALVCQLDVNLLKTVNDTLGHGAGDEHLKRAADTIKRSFGTEGTCYRTGGDEFTVLLLGVSLEKRADQCQKLMLSFADEQDTATHTLPPLEIACGIARVAEGEEHTLYAAQELADKRMYENKRAMKGLA